MAGMGRVYEIVDLYQILLVNPPLQIMAIYHIFGRYPPPPHAKTPTNTIFSFQVERLKEALALIA